MSDKISSTSFDKSAFSEYSGNTSEGQSSSSKTSQSSVTSANTETTRNFVESTSLPNVLTYPNRFTKVLLQRNEKVNSTIEMEQRKGPSSMKMF